MHLDELWSYGLEVIIYYIATGWTVRPLIDN